MTVIIWYTWTFTFDLHLIEDMIKRAYRQLKEYNEERWGKYAAVRPLALLKSLLHICVLNSKLIYSVVALRQTAAVYCVTTILFTVPTWTRGNVCKLDKKYNQLHLDRSVYFFILNTLIAITQSLFWRCNATRWHAHSHTWIHSHIEPCLSVIHT